LPLDAFKTQVLLLHSEQITLDNLSSGFNDSYTVHCATSGSEALNTIVETPINVIITAHDLTGMPTIENGVFVEIEAGVRMMFAIE